MVSRYDNGLVITLSKKRILISEVYPEALTDDVLSGVSGGGRAGVGDGAAERIGSEMVEVSLGDDLSFMKMFFSF